MGERERERGRERERESGREGERGSERGRFYGSNDEHRIINIEQATEIHSVFVIQTAVYSGLRAFDLYDFMIESPSPGLWDKQDSWVFHRESCRYAL